MSEAPFTQSPGAAGRIMALVVRNLWLWRRSWPRVLDIVYWPTLEILMWGFFARWMHGQGEGLTADIAAWMLGAALLWEVLLRAQFGFTISFFEEIWSRNLGHMFVAPLRPLEWVAALMAVGGIRAFIGLVPAFCLAAFAFHFNILDIGPELVLFYANLMVTGWWVALLVVSMILRFGMGAESMAWMVPFMLAPVSAIFYPVSALPDWLAWIALSLPPAHVFEGMRAGLAGQGFAWGHLAAAAGLNLFWGGIACLAFLAAFRKARRQGSLLSVGE